MNHKELFICFDCEMFETLTYQEAMNPPVEQCSNCHKRKWAKPLFLDRTESETEVKEVA